MADPKQQACPKCSGTIKIFPSGGGKHGDLTQYVAECGCGVKVDCLSSDGTRRGAIRDWNRWAKDEKARAASAPDRVAELECVVRMVAAVQVAPGHGYDLDAMDEAIIAARRVLAAGVQGAPAAITEADVTAALQAACVRNIPEARKDMRRALEAVFSRGVAAVHAEQPKDSK